jgi:pre-mRNA-processing factor 19
LTASPDATIRIWNLPTSQAVQQLRIHDGPVTGLSLHPTGDYVLSTSIDQHWAFSDIRVGQLLTKASHFGHEKGYFNIYQVWEEIHPTNYGFFVR